MDARDLPDDGGPPVIVGAGRSDEQAAELYAFAYEESVRSLDLQAATLDNIRSRSGQLFTGAGLVTALLASPAIDARGGVSPGGLLALAAFLAVVVCVFLVLWPVGDWRFVFDAEKIIERVRTVPSETLANMHRHLAITNEANWATNARKMKRLFWAFRVGSLFLVIEIAFWMASLSSFKVGGTTL